MSLSLSRLTLFTGTLFAVFAIAYLGIVNDTATRGYALSHARSRLEQLQTDQVRLEMDLASEQRLESLAPKFTDMGLSEHGGVSYVAVALQHAVTTAFASTASGR